MFETILKGTKQGLSDSEDRENQKERTSLAMMLNHWTPVPALVLVLVLGHTTEAFSVSGLHNKREVNMMGEHTFESISVVVVYYKQSGNHGKYLANMT